MSELKKQLKSYEETKNYDKEFLRVVDEYYSVDFCVDRWLKYKWLKLKSKIKKFNLN